MHDKPRPTCAACRRPTGGGDVPNIVIQDQRSVAEIKVHTGGGLGRFERWYGDDAYVPSKLVYLEHLLAECFPNTTVRIRLQ
jgi:hypothetical protein